MTKKKSLNIPSYLLTAIIYILIGVLFCAFKQAVISWTMLIVGVLLIVQGILDAVSNRITPAIIAIVIGAVLITLRFALADFIVKVFGIILAVSGIAQLFNDSKKKAISLISCVLTVIAGCLIVFFSGETLSIMFIVSGVLFIVDGVLILLGKRA